MTVNQNQSDNEFVVVSKSAFLRLTGRDEPYVYQTFRKVNLEVYRTFYVFDAPISERAQEIIDDGGCGYMSILNTRAALSALGVPEPREVVSFDNR